MDKDEKINLWRVGGGRGERETEPVPRHLGFPEWEILETSLEEMGPVVPRLLGE